MSGMFLYGVLAGVGTGLGVGVLVGWWLARTMASAFQHLTITAVDQIALSMAHPGHTVESVPQQVPTSAEHLYESATGDEYVPDWMRDEDEVPSS